MKDFRKLKVWTSSHKFAIEIYKLTGKFPQKEKYNLISQLNRAALSIPTNIAEGCGRDTDPDFARFLSIAIGSTSEVEYLLIFAKDLGYLELAKQQELNKNLNEIKRMLIAFYKKLKA